MWKFAVSWLHRTWWGIAVTYAVLVLASYLAIWGVVEPLSIPDRFAVVPDPLKTRAFYHILFALLIGCHASLFTELLRRRRLWMQSTPAAIHAAPVLETETAKSDETSPASEHAYAAAQTDQVADLAAKLGAYEMLEREIIGLLSPGDEISIGELPYRLGIGGGDDSVRKVRLAVANLFEAGRVVGTGGVLPKLKLATTRQLTPA